MRWKLSWLSGKLGKDNCLLRKVADDIIVDPFIPVMHAVRFVLSALLRSLAHSDLDESRVVWL